MEEIKTQYTHSKFGTFMFNLCAKATKFLLKHRWLYYLLACTWGIIMTFLGILISIVLRIASLFTEKIKFEKYHWIYGVKVGPEYWGGLEMGLMFLRDQKSGDRYINCHEFGHTFQNCILGPLFPFVVAIPSATRYWIQEFRSRKGKTNPPYSAVWFEDAADVCGQYAEDYILYHK